MNDRAVLDFLKRTGHLEYPRGRAQAVDVNGPVRVAIRSAEVLSAVASFQEFEAERMDRLALKHHGRSARFDGEIGPATREAMECPRCGCPDYGPDVEPAVGTGSWPRCHGIGDFHAATVHVRESQIPTFLRPHFEAVWDRTRAAYDDVGLRFIRDAESGANIDFSFVQRSDGWIGLAIVGRSESCASKIWCRYLATYRPQNILSEWTTLVMHELGHNAGLLHSRGGIMNPSIVHGLAPTWRGDPSEPILRRYYGGDPIEPPPAPGREYWIAQGLKSNHGRTEWIPLTIPIPIQREDDA